MEASKQEISKEEAVSRVNALPRDPSKKNQQAIVSLMQNIGGIVKKVHVIPGGAKLIEYEDEASLPLAVFNWLRISNEFERIEISLIGDYSSYEDLADYGIKPKRQKVQDFKYNKDGKYFWQTKGIRHLADLIGKQLSGDSPVSVIVEKDGLYVISDSSEKFGPEHKNWEPVVIIHKIKKH